MDSEQLLVEVRERVGTLTLNRPDKLNALTREMNDAAVDALKSLAADPDVGCIVLTGAGRGFCGGGDVESMHKGSEFASAEIRYEEAVDLLRQRHEFSWLLYSLPKVTVAAINGPAAGAGLGLALSCDLRLMSEQARLVTAYANIGYGGDYGTTWQLTRLVGPARAKELLFLSDPVTAQEAVQLGLANRVLPQETFTEEVRAVAERIGRGPLVSYRYMKGNVNAAVTTDFRTLLDREAETHLRCGRTEDFREGVAAFMEKRRPRFRGR